MSRITPLQPRSGDGLKLAFLAVLTFTLVVIVGTIIGEAPTRSAAILGIVYVLSGLSALSGLLYVILERKTLQRRISRLVQSRRR